MTCLVTSLEEVKLGIVGCGTMGRCIMSALVETGTLEWSQIQATVHREETRDRLLRLFPSSTIWMENESVCKWANIILIW